MRNYLIFLISFFHACCLYAAELVSVRLGHHPEKTRLVLDLKGEVRFDQRKLTVYNVHIPEKYLGTHKGTGHIYSYTFLKVGNNLVMAFDYHESASIQKIFGLSHPPRIVIDIGHMQEIETPDSNSKLVADKIINNKPVQKKTFQSHRIEKKPEINALMTTQKIIGSTYRHINVPVPLIKPRLKTIIIDPGHGGKDPGTIGLGKVYEKDIVLRVAKLIQQSSYQAGLPYNVRLTRGSDIYIPLRERYEVARKARADIFLSLHADSHKNKTVSGVSIYTLSEQASDTEAELLAKKENKADLVAGVDLAYASPDVTNILISLTQRETQNRSERFARLFTRTIPQQMHSSTRPHRSADFAVLKAPDIPSVLIELGYLSNQKDRRLLQEKDYQKKLASRIVGVIDSYFKSETL